MQTSKLQRMNKKLKVSLGMIRSLRKTQKKGKTPKLIVVKTLSLKDKRKMANRLWRHLQMRMTLCRKKTWRR